jgi:putative ABC transport system permease protein
LRGFYVFIACIALGVMAIAGVGSVAASLSEGLTREGRTLLGGDVAFSLIQREAKPEEIAFLRARGQVSVAARCASWPAAVTASWRWSSSRPWTATTRCSGELTLDPKMPMADLLAERDGAFGAAVDSTLLARLDLKLGDRITIGNASFQIRSASAPSRTSSPAMSAWARAFWSAKRACAPPGCCSPAAWCAGCTA